MILYVIMLFHQFYYGPQKLFELNFGPLVEKLGHPWLNNISTTNTLLTTKWETA